MSKKSNARTTGELAAANGVEVLTLVYSPNEKRILSVVPAYPPGMEVSSVLEILRTAQEAVLFAVAQSRIQNDTKT